MSLNKTFLEVYQYYISFLFKLLIILSVCISLSFFCLNINNSKVANNRVAENTNIKLLKTEEKSFSGLPNVNLKLSRLDTSGNLIYAGIDLAVFQDSDSDGQYTVKAGKVKRFINTHTQFTVDLGSVSEYEKGVKHKLAMRTLYVPTGTDQNLIVIADKNNGQDGWVEIPGSLFVPSYFINASDNPYIKHTDKWDKNRLAYNKVKSEIGLEILERSPSTFWSGEKFMLNIETSEEIPTLKVSISGTPYSKIIPVAKVTSEGALYTGELWDKDMFMKWGNYLPKELVFKIEALEEGKLLEEKEIPITLDNRDQFYRIRREF